MRANVFHPASRQTSELLLLQWKVHIPTANAIGRNFVRIRPGSLKPQELITSGTVLSSRSFAAQSKTRKD
jgi:hypothetical protein